MQLDQHTCERVVCIDLSCVNRTGTAQVHQYRIGCRFCFTRLDTQAKWYALHALLLPDSKQPPWSMLFPMHMYDAALLIHPGSVCIAVGNEHTVVSQLTGGYENLHPQVNPEVSLPGPAVERAQAGFNAADVPNMTVTASDRVDRTKAVDIAGVIFEQFQTMIEGQRRQNEAIMASDGTVTRLRCQNADLQLEHERTQQELERTNAMNSNLQDQINEMRQEMRQVQLALLSIERSHQQRNVSISEFPMELDTPWVSDRPRTIGSSCA